MLLLFIILVLVFSIPAVQNKLGKYATQEINKEFNTNINVGGLGLKLNGDVALKNIYIEDYKKDTLIHILELNTSILNFRKIYNGKFTFGDIDIEGLTFTIKTYKGEENTNLDVFVAKFDDDKPRDEKSDFLLSSSDLSIYGGTFRMINENKTTPKLLAFKDININTTNFLIHGSDVSTRINTMAFTDSRGLEMKNLATNFTYTPAYMTFDALEINTKSSKVEGNLKFTYNREDLQYFTDKVMLEATFNTANVALNELNTFYNEFGFNQRALFSVQLSGTLNNLTASNLNLTTSSRSRINGDITFVNLFSKEENNFEMDATFTNLSSNYQDLKNLLPNVLGESIPSVFDKLGNFTIVGKSHLTARDIDADLKINTELGKIDSNLRLQKINDIDNASYKGNVVFTDFDLGAILGDPKIEETSLNVDVDGKGFTLEKINTNLHGVITSLTYNKYAYHNIDVSGTLKNKIYNGILIADDENFKLDFNGLADFSEEIYRFDFVADVSHANLRELNFVTNDSIAYFKGIVDMKMTGTSVNDALGTITFKNTEYRNQNDTYLFKDFKITSTFDSDIRTIDINSPDIIQGKITGIFKLEEIGKLIENSLGSLYTNYKPYKISKNQFINFNFNIYNKIVDVFYPEIELAPNTYIRGRIENNEKAFVLNFKSPEIKLFDYFAKEVQLQVDNDNPLFNTTVEIDSIATKYYNVSKLNLVNITLNDTLFVRTEFNGGKNNKDAFNLNLYHTINPENKSVVGLKTSDITFRDNTWVFNQAKDSLHKVTFDKYFKAFAIEKIAMTHQDERIELLGELRDSTYKDIKLNFNNVDLEKITPRLDSLKLTGKVNGKLDILQQNGTYLPNSLITIDNFKVNNTLLGAFKANIKGNESLTNYNVDVTIKDEEIPSFRATGDINVSGASSSIDVALDFNDFNLAPLNPLGEDVINNIRGFTSGKVSVTGNLNQPDISGNLRLTQSGLLIPYLNVDLQFEENSKISLTNQQFNLDKVNIIDTAFNSKGILDGTISHTNFSNWNLDLQLSTPRFLVLNTKETDDALYFGTGFIGGTASIAGPTSNLFIEVDAETKQGTNFKIPLNDSESFGDNTFIKFLSPEEKVARIKGEDIQLKEITGLGLFFDLDITKDAQIELVIDKESGSKISGRGEGALLIDINTNGKFNIYGDFSVFEGQYDFFYKGIVQKEFKVNPGSTLSWDGDPLKARINIEAVYSTQVNPSPLLDTPITRDIPVDVRILLTGQLEKPEPEFGFNFPNLSSDVKSELEYRLGSKEERDNQALFLLTTGSFSRGIGDIFNVTGTINERLNGLINGILGDGSVGVNYEMGTNRPEYQTSDRLGLTLKTKISDRVIFNGKVGVPIGGVSETVIAGDFQIDFLLNEEGTLTAKVFNRENSIRNFGEEIGYTQGLGISYNVEFDNFKELIRKLFTSSKKEENKSKNPEKNPSEEEKLTPEFINFKASKEEN
ncbi:MAG TPA: translocation/assembly module TamB domain-containing protein [Flavobacteriaceae bacterium]|nr:translocation/assembly module TamB domain-containing protein [Flavobacteriaceae bacterium]